MVRVWFVFTFRTVTVALVTTACFSSNTLPEIVPVVWPSATTEQLNRTASKRGRSLVAFMDSLPSSRVAVLRWSEDGPGDPSQKFSRNVRESQKQPIFHSKFVELLNKQNLPGAISSNKWIRSMVLNGLDAQITRITRIGAV